MPLPGEESVVNSQYVQLINRASLSTSVTTTSVVANAGHAGIPPATPGPDVFFPVPNGQGIRVVHAVGRVQDPGSTNQLTLLSAAVFAWGGNGFNIFARPYPATNIPLGDAWIYYTSDELLLYTDYLEQKGLPPNVHIGLQANIANADAGSAHNVTLRLDLLVEYYLLRPPGHLGYP